MNTTWPALPVGNDQTSRPLNGLGQRGPLRVCMVAYAFYESDTRILQYATALAERGDTVDVIALNRDNSKAAFDILDGVNVYRIQSRSVNERGLYAYGSRILRFLFGSMRKLIQLQAKHAYDVVHVHNVPDFLVFAALPAKARGAKVILDIHDLLPEFYASKFKVSHSSLLFRLMRWIETASAAFADHVIIANHLWKDRLVERSSRNDKCSVVRNRPDLAIFSHSPETVRQPGAPYIMIYPGSLNWHQGLDIAIKAFARIQTQIPDAEFHIYGEGSAKPSLIKLAHDLGQEKRIIFHDFLPSQEIAQRMALADLAIEPKRTKSAFSNEALSTKIMEFMALGVPVIACRTKIHAYYYDDSIISFYEDDDEVQLADHMLRLKNDPALCAELVHNARTYVQQNTWNACKGEFLQLVDTIVAPVSKTAVV